MTKEQLAALLNGRQYRDEINKDEAKAAKEAGLVVIYGASDDLVEFEGAIHDEIGAYDGTTFWLTRKGPLEEHEDCECKYCGFQRAKDTALEIQAIWGKGGYSWQYETKAPHATFEIMEDGEKYCRGIVLSLNDIQPF